MSNSRSYWVVRFVTFRYGEETRFFGVIAEFGWSQRGWKKISRGAPISYSRQLTYISNCLC